CVEWSVTTRSPCSPRGSGRSSRAFTIVKTIEVAPIPSPSVASAAIAKPGRRARRRAARRRSVVMPSCMTARDFNRRANGASGEVPQAQRNQARRQAVAVRIRQGGVPALGRGGGGPAQQGGLGRPCAVWRACAWEPVGRRQQALCFQPLGAIPPLHSRGTKLDLRDGSGRAKRVRPISEVE